jgi:hypothetical protein
MPTFYKTIDALGISWRRAAGEFVLIVVGVLAALAVNSWNDYRADRRLEQEYLRRLVEDLTADTTLIASTVKGLADKEASLSRLARLPGQIRSLRPEASGVLSDLRTSTFYGWIVPPLRTVTYEDLLSTGRLDLIRDPTVRASVIDYYQASLHRANRIERRRSGFPAWVYSAVPSGLATESPSSGAALSPEDIDAIVETLGTAEVGRLLTAELNYAVFSRNEIAQTGDHARQLLGLLGQALGR